WVVRLVREPDTGDLSRHRKLRYEQEQEQRQGNSHRETSQFFPALWPDCSSDPSRSAFRHAFQKLYWPVSRRLRHLLRRRSDHFTHTTETTTMPSQADIRQQVTDQILTAL